ncbi:MAG: DinB family protein [Phycisphaerae bacterium]|nr:DinB family protein [Phycisphaerae bacterium]
MNAPAAIKASLEQSRQWLTVLLGDVKDTATTFPTPKGGNHPLWALGHVIHSEASMVARFILGRENPLSKWEPLFGMGSVPVADAGKYPSVEELMAEFEKVRAVTLETLDACTDADLDRKSHAPEEYAVMFGTVGQCFISVGLHCAFHAGQVADARRAAGKGPVFG